MNNFMNNFTKLFLLFITAIVLILFLPQIVSAGSSVNGTITVIVIGINETVGDTSPEQPREYGGSGFKIPPTELAVPEKRPEKELPGKISEDAKKKTLIPVFEEVSPEYIREHWLKKGAVQTMILIILSIIILYLIYKILILLLKKERKQK